ncbi:DNA polymerase III subunit gamma/tau [Sphingomicrobium sediminis]|uniref:DNA polymerase III subunit gamma/tau n=1 Tax=Sphingomicrobium sediminis TaxID=2950949 RepID=A0A9X2EG84_9SPHN|nr:DNA polymerase III subunit gamma/tau [Sphingomicrobium sediminis]MCM8556806.1 DNA polymerase III subunit gamma/tau [Sphingomicrobium sediminis]
MPPGPGLGLDEPEQPQSAAKPEAYQVLARKYRPQSFDALIGQDAMVRTLGNAIRTDRIAHAFLMTGVRGVGKTSTARLIAKALNCIGPDGNGGPTIDPCGVCEPCVAIAEGRHIDVVEMDAASHTGVDDMREIIEAVRYASVSARYKIYIIDEVHMLSKSAFNALLKTLEEPPPHVKFLFATTEVDKVPVTVLSRCQRFDLRRIPAELLASHFGSIAEKEGIKVEDDALAIIARAAEGSVRDGLSLLDQAIAHGGAEVSAAEVRDMLGLADRGRVRGLLDILLDGDAGKLLAALDEAHGLGVEPQALMRGLLDALHAISRRKASGQDDVMRSAEEQGAIAADAEAMGWPQLHALWQLLLKGLKDVETAPDPREAADMALLRAIHAAGQPDPGAVIDAISSGKTPPAPSPTKSDPAPAADAPAAALPETPPATRAERAPAGLPVDFQAFVDLIDDARPRLGVDLHDKVGLVSYDAPRLMLQPKALLDSNFARELADEAKKLTGAAWQIDLQDHGGAPSLAEQVVMKQQAEREDALADPMVKAVTDAFPDAQLESIKDAS